MSGKENSKPLTLKLDKVTDQALMEELLKFDSEFNTHSEKIENLKFGEYVNDEKIKSLKKRMGKGLKDFEISQKGNKLTEDNKIQNMVGFIESQLKNNGKHIPQLLVDIEALNEIKSSVNSITNASGKEDTGVTVLEKLNKDASAKKDATFAEWKKKTDDEKADTEKMKEELEEALKNLQGDLSTKVRKMDILDKENDNLKGHLEKIEEDIGKQRNLYDEDFEKRKGEVDTYTEKLDKHIGEMDTELEKLDQYKVDKKQKKADAGEKEAHHTELSKKHELVQQKMATFDDFFKSTKKTMEKLRVKINQIDTDQSGYEEKHDNRCESMINVISKNRDLRKGLTAEDKKIVGMENMLKDLDSKIAKLRE